MPQSGSDSVLANLLARRQKLSAARQKLGLEAPQRAGIQSNLRGIGVPGRTPTQPGAAPARTTAPAAAKPAARQPAPRQAAAAPQPTGAPGDKGEQMLARAQEFLGMVQYAKRRQPRADTAVLGRSRQMLAGGV